MDQKLMSALLVTALVLFSIYRRVRRNFGRQQVSEGRLKFRIGVLAVVGTLILFSTLQAPSALEAMLAGIAGGIVLAMIGLKHTKFEATSEGRFYIPHTYTGLFVTALFLGRLGYRLIMIYGQVNDAATQDPNPFASLKHNPLTVLVFGLLVGYYIYFNLGVLRRSRLLPVPAASPPAASADSSTPA